MSCLCSCEYISIFSCCCATCYHIVSTTGIPSLVSRRQILLCCILMLMTMFSQLMFHGHMCLSSFSVNCRQFVIHVVVAQEPGRCVASRQNCCLRSTVMYLQSKHDTGFTTHNKIRRIEHTTMCLKVSICK